MNSEPELSDSEPYAQSQHIFRFPGDQERFAGLLHTDRPIEIEVGSGKGLFLRGAAPVKKDTQFIGLEIAAKYAQSTAEKLRSEGISNAECFCADAVRVIDELIPDASLSAVHVYFPDPWWKARHKKRRVLNPRMIRAIDRALVPGGKLHFWTDVIDYYESTVAMIAELTNWEGPLLVAQREAQDDMDYHTHFERRTRRNGMPVYRTLYLKKL
jgi:tRNA (guanine-N7-)-methyltransferase